MTTVSGVRHEPTHRRPAAPKKAMFAFLAPQAKDLSDPLQNAKAAATWLRQLPSLDVIGRQQQVIAGLDAMRKMQRAPDLNRIHAIQFVDAALGADRRQLIKQYIENSESAPKLADRIWQALWEMSQSFTLAYQSALETAMHQANNTRWKAALPLLFVRLVHFHGTDAKLRVFKYERWIPAKWIELHGAYLRACETQCDRQPIALPAAGANAQAWSVEQEYLYVLLVHQLNTGNLSPIEIDCASRDSRWLFRRGCASDSRASESISAPRRRTLRPNRAPSRSRFLRSRARRAPSARRWSRMTRSPPVCRRGAIRCGRSRIAASQV